MAAVGALDMDDDASLTLGIGIDEQIATAVAVASSVPCRSSGIDLDDELIMLVKAFPELYDQSLPTFRNIARRTGIWRNIATKLRRSVDNVTNRWKLLRDRYCRELKKRAKSGGKQVGPKWCKFDSMGFIRPHVKHRGQNNAISMTWDINSSADDANKPCHVDGIEFSNTAVDGLNAKPIVNSNKNSSDYLSRSDSLLRPRKRLRAIVPANDMTDELNQTQGAYNGGTTHFLSGLGGSPQNGVLIGQSRAPIRRIDTLCQLMEQRYMSLPFDLQEEFDIEVLRLLQDFGRRMCQKEIEVQYENGAGVE